ncbi:MAG: P-II family nitrogen regulator [Methylococcales bacterium]|nr:P-II family nitrogen regulator [Methylococcales bacterium]
MFSESLRIVDFLPKNRLEIVVANDRLNETIEEIVKAAATGKIGDGKIFVIEQDQVIRIRTGEAGEEAI